MRFVLISLMILSGCANTSKAEGYATEYAAVNFPNAQVNNVQCERSDSDGNGRVRCNLSLKVGNDFRVESIECPSNWLPQPFKTTCVGLKSIR